MWDFLSAVVMLTQFQLIKKYGLRIRGHLGQHLLIDPHIPKKIIALLKLEKGDWVLEIGPGLGALTSHLSELPIHLTVVEKDPRFVEILKKELDKGLSLPSLRGSGARNDKPAMIEIIHEDILKFDFEKHFKGLPAGKKIKAVSNLPYYITAPILFQLIDHRHLISEAVLMMQKEVADRLTAKPGTKDYGKLTLAVQYAARAEQAFHVSPACFTPQPEIESSVLVLKMQPPLLPENEEKLFLKLIRIAFAQRRKVLASLLIKEFKIVSRTEIVQLLEGMNLPPDVRGERLGLEEYFQLTWFLKIKEEEGKIRNKRKEDE